MPLEIQAVIYQKFHSNIVSGSAQISVITMLLMMAFVQMNATQNNAAMMEAIAYFSFAVRR